MSVAWKGIWEQTSLEGRWSLLYKGQATLNRWHPVNSELWFCLSTLFLCGHLGPLKGIHSFLISEGHPCGLNYVSLISESQAVRRVCKWCEGSLKGNCSVFWSFTVPLFNIWLICFAPNSLRRFITDVSNFIDDFAFVAICPTDKPPDGIVLWIHPLAHMEVTGKESTDF